MYSLLQSKRVRGAAGEPLPVAFQALEDAGVRFLRGQVVLIAAGPGTGKSGFVLNLTLRSGVPALYFSADSDAFEQLVRGITITAGWSREQAVAAVLSNRLPVDLVSSLTGRPARFNYNASPNLGDIETSVAAYEEVYGDYPSLIIVDNITNVQADMGGEEGDSSSGLEGLMDYLHTMARETEACVVGLHHVTGPYNDADKPIPLSGVKGQIARVPYMVLTLHKRPEDDWNVPRIGVSPVKNRGGKADQTGQTFVELEFIGDQMLIRDPEVRQPGREAQPAPPEYPERDDLRAGEDPFRMDEED